MLNIENKNWNNGQAKCNITANEMLLIHAFWFLTCRDSLILMQRLTPPGPNPDMQRLPNPDMQRLPNPDMQRLAPRGPSPDMQRLPNPDAETRTTLA